MTIAAGFVCPDGILLASDTQYSNTGMGLRAGPKLWILDHGDILVVFGGAGSEARLLRTRDEIDRKLRPGMSRIRVVDAIDAVLQKVSGKLRHHADLNMQGLFAVRIHDDLVLYESQIGVDMLNPIGGGCQCVGYGQGLGWYFASSLFRAGMNLKWAKIVAAYLVKECKTYSEYCGGETHLIEIPRQGPATKIDDQDQIRALEGHLAPLGDALRIVLPGDDTDTSDSTLEHRLKMLTEAISKARNVAAAVDVGGARVVVRGYAPEVEVGPPPKK